MTSERTNQPGQPGQPGQPDPEPAAEVKADRKADELDSLNVTDPTVIRALAHPVRIGLIELFGVRDTLTATQASEALGESPANCAFHLRTLAKYGFVEEAGGGRGRERPWRATKPSIRIRLNTADLDSQQAQVAAGALEQVWHDRWVVRVREAFASRAWSPEWEDSSGSSQTVTFLTPAELRAVREEIGAVISRHMEQRRLDPASRPAGALPVEIVTFAYPRLDLAALAAEDADAAGAQGDEDPADSDEFDNDDEDDDEDGSPEELD